MPDRKMFWRIVRRLFAAQRGRLLVILLALGASAALTAASSIFKWMPATVSPKNFASSAPILSSLRETPNLLSLALSRWTNLSSRRCVNRSRRAPPPIPISIW